LPLPTFQGLKLEHAKLESKNQILEKRLGSNEKLIADATKVKNELEEKLKYSNKELDRLRSCLALLEESREAETKKLRSETAQSTADLTKQLSSVRLLLTEEQERSKRLNTRIAEIQQSAMNQINELAKGLENHDNYNEKYMVAKDEILRLENLVEALQEDKLQSTRDHDAECHRLQHAIESCHHEVRLRTMEANEVTKECAIEKLRAEKLHKDLLSMNGSLKSCEQKCLLLEQEKKKLSDSIEHYKQQKASLEHKLEVLSNEMNEIKQSAVRTRAEVDDVSNVNCALDLLFSSSLNRATSILGEPKVYEGEEEERGIQGQSAGSSSS
jgi:chromosome segregation ATPase